MSESNGFPEWLRELGAKVDKLTEEGRRTDERINALVDTAYMLIRAETRGGETAKLQHDIITALEGQLRINQEVNERLGRLEVRPQ